MGSYGVWYWMIVLLMILFQLGVAALAVRFNDGDGRLGRKSFTLRVVGLVAFAAILNAVLASAPWSAAAVMLVGMSGMALIAHWSVDRLRDIGRPKALAVLTAVPFVGFLCVVYLMVRRGAAA